MLTIFLNEIHTTIFLKQNLIAILLQLEMHLEN